MSNYLGLARTKNLNLYFSTTAEVQNALSCYFRSLLWIDSWNSLKLFEGFKGTSLGRFYCFLPLLMCFSS